MLKHVYLTSAYRYSNLFNHAAACFGNIVSSQAVVLPAEAIAYSPMLECRRLHVQAVLLCNAVPVVLQLLWSQSSQDFTSATVLMHVLLARMPRMEQQALLQEMLTTGALLRLLSVMSEVEPCFIL